MTDDEWKPFQLAYEKSAPDIRIFMNGIEDFFINHPSVKSGNRQVIHSVKKRMKHESHLRDKIVRKNASGPRITPENLTSEVTDLAGVRLLLLFQEDFKVIDASIREKIAGGDWVLGERAMAFTWDPEATKFFGEFDLQVKTRETFYTSVHYLIKPRPDSMVCCELQVRTLFEEIWGEVDHLINYPNPTEILACREQLMVLSKIVGAGSRLVDSIQRTMNETVAGQPVEG